MRFNLSTQASTQTVNHEGAKAYVLTAEMELYSAVVTTMLSDANYEDGTGRLDRIRTLVDTVNPGFVARLAIYAREQMYLRSAPVVLANELAKVHNGDGLVSRMVERVVQRPDEITELLAYYQQMNQRTGVKKLNRISKQMQKGLATAFNKFDEYQFAKYDRATAIKLRDALFLVHPKAKDDAQQAIFDKIVNGTLDTPYTWETELSALGQATVATEEQKTAEVQAKWEELIDSNRLGYMALLRNLRNLRNLIQAGVSTTHLEKVCAYLSSEQAVAKSKQLPFRFLAAYRELVALQSDRGFSITSFSLGRLHSPKPAYHVTEVLDAIEKAITHSVANLRGFDADTSVVIACDVSGSMQKAISAKSKVLLYDIGLILAMLLQSKSKNVLSGMFGDRWKTVSLPSQRILANVDAFYKREGEVGYSTNGYLVLDDLINRRYKADKVMLFTDTQLWDSVTYNQLGSNTMSAKWTQYKKFFPNARLYLFDLAGYGQAPLRVEQNDVYLLAGWSDKVFDVLHALEEGQTTLSVIDKITL